MYRFSYAEVLEETPQTARERERAAIDHSVELLKSAQIKGNASMECVEAIYFLRRLWAFLIEDLAKAENDLPKALRADLISVGLWIMREAEQVRLKESSNFKGLIEVSQLISEGLR
jgi:flagellar protein FlaF